jgi:Dehydrogenase E1 component
MEPWQVMASFMGKATSPTGGRDGTLHYGRLDLNIYNLPSHIPANYPVAIGTGFAAQYRGQDRVSLAFCGDGSTSRADWHESLNIAGVLKLPCVFVVENNQFAYSTPLGLQTASDGFAVKAVAYGMPGVKVDGTDVLAVHDATAEAVARAGGAGPVADRGGDDADARSRRARLGRLRTAGDVGRVGEEGSGGAVRGLPDCRGGPRPRPCGAGAQGRAAARYRRAQEGDV